MNKWVFIILIIAVVIVAAALFLPRQATSIINNQEQSAETPAGSAAAPVSGIGVYRLLQNSVKPDQEFDVVLNISLGEKKYYIIDESIPDEFVVIDRGAGALSKDAGTRTHIKWVVFTDAKSAMFSYKLQAPDKPGAYTFSGSFVLENDDEKIIMGNNEIIVS